MKLLVKKRFIPIMLLGLIFASCSKYEEGSSFTFLTKKARIVNEWTLETTQIANLVYPESSSLVNKYVFNKDNSYVRSITTVGNGASTMSYPGTWDFSPDKTKLLLVEDGSNSTIELFIIELKSKELKLKVSAYNTGNPPILKFKGL